VSRPEVSPRIYAAPGSGGPDDARVQFLEHVGKVVARELGCRRRRLGVQGRDSNSFNVYTLEVDEGGKYHIIRCATHMER
jgi:hypothetical protein